MLEMFKYIVVLYSAAPIVGSVFFMFELDDWFMARKLLIRDVFPTQVSPKNTILRGGSCYYASGLDIALFGPRLFMF